MIPELRLHNQQISGSALQTPGELVHWMGAMQAQDYAGAKWAIGARLPGVTNEDVEQALADKAIIRTWPMRGTLHFVAPSDVHWMLQLLTPRILAGTATRRKNLSLSDADLAISHNALAKALQGGKQLMRKEMLAVLEQAGQSTANQRGYHILWDAAQTGLTCIEPMQAKQQTFVLLDEWIPAAKPLARDEALATLALRYFTSHGPATIHDLTWWSGLTVKDARAGLASVESKLASETIDGVTYWMPQTAHRTAKPSSSLYLLPGFDEYILGYRDRGAVLQAAHAKHINPGANGMFSPMVVIDGQVVGVWKRTFKKDSVVLKPQPFGIFSAAQQQAIVQAAHRYGAFLGLSAQVIF
jgi:hypothetical protein